MAWALAQAAWLWVLAWLCVAWDPCGEARAPLSFSLGAGAHRIQAQAALVRGSDVRALRLAAFFWRHHPHQDAAALAELAARWGLGGGFEVEGVLLLPGGARPFVLRVGGAAGALALHWGEGGAEPPPPLGGAGLRDLFRAQAPRPRRKEA